VVAFDDVAAGIRAIPREGGAWYRAKEAALAAVAADKDLPLHPSAVRLMRAILDNFNHDDGFDFGGRDHYADVCGMDVSTVRRALKGLGDHGYALRRREKRPGQYDLWQTTLPVLLNASAVVEAGREAKKSRVFWKVVWVDSRS
jgi:hypothetical protein